MSNTPDPGTAASKYDDLSGVASLILPGLFTCFHSALAVLRTSRFLGQLVEEGEETPQLTSFFDLLAKVEMFLLSSTSGAFEDYDNVFVVVVEGLDGSGKSSLVQGLTSSSSFFGYECQATGTPTASMTAVRPVFDRQGGLVARAFYMCSNYVLHYEIHQLAAARSRRVVDNHPTNKVIVVVDRWYASTAAYSIAYKNTTGGCETIDALDCTLFQWPLDLLRPDLMLLLRVDDTVRRERVHKRAKPDDDNPWDRRLNDDTQLGQRIMRALERVTGPREIRVLDANTTQSNVLQEGQKIVRDHVIRRFQPLEYFRQQPLEFFRWSASQQGLCNAQTGIRGKHELWDMQIAFNALDMGAPSLRSVGIMSVSPAGIMFFTWGIHPGGGRGGDKDGLVSIVSRHGRFPTEQQWRAEGFVYEVSQEECAVLDAVAPTSLQSQIFACQEFAGDNDDGGERRVMPHGYQSVVKNYRASIDQAEALQVATRPSNPTQGFCFVPLRMEVLIGGPGSPSGPVRLEWTRSALSSTNWTDAKKILPFSPPCSVLRPVLSMSKRPVVVALTGTHCSGKKTIGERLAAAKTWSFHGELGDLLRDKASIVSSGHILGDGTGANNSSEWDEKVHQAELARDHESDESRVVETWHVGNLAWNSFRNKGKVSKDDRDRVLSAIREHSKKACLIFVHLSVPVEVSRNRHQEPVNAQRLPMENVFEECTELHDYLNEKCLAIIEDKSISNLGIPIKIVDNSKDGRDAIEETTRGILQFVNQHLWKAYS